MHKIFNCGIGFILSVSPKDADKIIVQLNADTMAADIIGKAIPGNGKIKIESMFSNKEIEF